MFTERLLAATIFCLLVLLFVFFYSGIHAFFQAWWYRAVQEEHHCTGIYYG